MAKRSEMWIHFSEVVIGGILQKGKCNYCNHEIKAHQTINGTSALKSHFSTCKFNPHNKKNVNQSILQVRQGETPLVSKFDPEAIRKAIAEMIIEDELPFATSEKSGFRKLMSIACPHFSMPSRKTTTRDAVGIYFEEKAKLKLFMKQSCQRACLTTDCWTSQQQDGYMTITAHFIDGDWKLHKKIISYCMVKGHKGDGIGKNLEQCLMEWGIEKVMTITVDKYFMGENEEDNIKFDILAWWKLNASRFPVLVRLARDVLAIPVSTVASESAFSTGGRVLDDFRTSLTPFMVQVLVCSQDWLKRSTPINIEEDMEELEILEKELLEEYATAKSAKSKTSQASNTCSA